MTQERGKEERRSETGKGTTRSALGESRLIHEEGEREREQETKGNEMGE